MRQFAGALTLARLLVRLDRTVLTVWLVLPSLLNYLLIRGFVRLLANSPAAAADHAAIARTPVGIFLGGPNYGIDHYNAGSLFLNEQAVNYELVLGIGIILLAVRYTRSQEASGRLELINSTAIGRCAQTTATWIVLALVGVGMSGLCWVTSCLAGLSVLDSLVVNVGCCLFGWTFSAVVLLIALIATSPRLSRISAGCALAVGFAMRGIGDLMSSPGGSWLSWISPLAWVQQTRAYSDLRWWPVALQLVTVAGFGGAAIILQLRRDFNRGLVKTPVSDAVTGGLHLRGLVALAARLLGMNWLLWVLGGIALGAVCGPFATLGVVHPPGGHAVMPGAAMADSYVASVLSYGAVFALWFGITVIGPMRRAELDGVAELAWSLPLGRGRGVAAFGLIGALGGAVIIQVTALVLTLTMPASARGPGVSLAQALGTSALAAAAYIPALIATIGLAIAQFGVAPSWAPINWIVLGYSYLFMLMSRDLGLPEWLSKLGPLSASPQLPGQAANWVSLASLVAAGLGLAVLGLARLRRRDLVSL